MNDELEQIGLQMLRVLPRAWVYDVMHLAESREAFRLFLGMWRDAADDAERAEIVAELQGLLDDRERSPEAAAPRSKGDLDALVLRRRALKTHLRKLIEERGGISEIARRADMPQPSLSRLLNSGAEPRSATMARLARAMGLSVSRLYPAEGDDEDAEVFDLQEHRRGRYQVRDGRGVRARARA